MWYTCGHEYDDYKFTCRKVGALLLSKIIKNLFCSCVCIFFYFSTFFFFFFLTFCSNAEMTGLQPGDMIVSALGDSEGVSNSDFIFSKKRPPGQVVCS